MLSTAANKVHLERVLYGSSLRFTNLDLCDVRGSLALRYGLERYSTKYQDGEIAFEESGW